MSKHQVKYIPVQDVMSRGTATNRSMAYLGGTRVFVGSKARFIVQDLQRSVMQFLTTRRETLAKKYQNAAHQMHRK